MNETTTYLVILLLAVVTYGTYLTATIKGDGVRLSNRQPPASNYPDMFGPRHS